MPEHTPRVDYKFGHFELQPSERRLLANGAPVTVGPRAFDLLIALVERAGELVSKEELLERVWPKLVVEENNLQVQVSTLRKLFGPDAITTVPGRGYRFTLMFERATASGQRDETMPSIAVLPFVNMSGDEENEYFADGVSEELLNVLSKIAGLRVASRTSAFYFKGKDVDLPTIAQKLNVATVLEGSVRKAAKRVRIAVQLIQADTDAHLWSETYDRELEDIFAVQDDIAQSVVKELRRSLLGQEPDSLAIMKAKGEVMTAAKGRSENTEAYRFYLKGRFLVDRYTPEASATGIESLRQAIELDPEYATAWAELARGYNNEGTRWNRIVDGFERARAAAHRALRLQPDLAEGHLALGLVLMNHDRDWEGAQASYARALELAPGNADAVRAAASLAGKLGRIDDAVELHRRAVALDPLNVLAHRTFAWWSYSAGFLVDAEVAIRKACELSPQGGFNYNLLAIVLLALGRVDEALEVGEREPDEAFRLFGIALAQYARGRRSESDAALRELVEKHAEATYQIGEAYAFRGEVDAAFEWLERDRANAFGEMMWDPLLRSLHSDPRWEPFLKTMGSAD